MSTEMAALDTARLNNFVNQFVQDCGAAIHAVTVLLGDRLGLYQAMADGTPVTSGQLAAKAGCDERYIREWLAAQAASGYVDYDPADQTYRLPPEHALTLTSDENPLFIPAAYYIISSMFKDEEKFADMFRSGKGLGWHEHHPDLFCGTLRFFKPTYVTYLVQEWIPALEGVQAKLEAGAKVADVGCGLGASTLLMAKAFPNSEFWGFDYHPRSIEDARKDAAKAGVSNVHFETASSKEFPGSDYDLIAFFDCLHDMGDPVGALQHARKALKPDGTILIVEPFAQDAVEGNLNPVGRIFYAASTCICTPASRSQEVGLGLGAQAGEARLRTVAEEAGFTRFRRAAETPFNLILEARP